MGKTKINMEYLERLCNKKDNEYNIVCLSAYAKGIIDSKAPEMLRVLIDAVNEKKSGCNISDGWYIRVEKLIKEATEI